jgi:hypothetical protein
LSVNTDVGSVHRYAQPIFLGENRHDFKIFKQSRIWKYRIIQNSNSELDLGFLGVHNYLKNAIIPHKSSKKRRLTKQQKRENHELSSSRIRSIFSQENGLSRRR